MQAFLQPTDFLDQIYYYLGDTWNAFVIQSHPDLTDLLYVILLGF